MDSQQERIWETQIQEFLALVDEFSALPFEKQPWTNSFLKREDVLFYVEGNELPLNQRAQLAVKYAHRWFDERL